MIFPTLSLWSSPSARSASELIDRSLENRQLRLLAGLSVDSNFTKVHGCLLISQGQGKFVRFKHAIAASAEIPVAIRDGCVAVAKGQDKNLNNLRVLLRDLAEIQSLVVEQLKQQAGKYVDRILTVAITDPGLWFSDFDGSQCYVSMCDPMTVAEKSGVSVIDAICERDLAVGGSGKQLDALPIWLLMADRDHPVAVRHRTFIHVRDSGIEVFSLPPSDGLDAELPPIGFKSHPPDASLSQIMNEIKRATPNTELIVHSSRTPKSSEHDQADLNNCPASISAESLFGPGINFDALTAAWLGIFHVDQLPANVPRLTGADSQRILGRLTPGRPSNWRQLIRAMSQRRPAPMKLKDAV
jgi:1,6-anhydro-N-acetylmuramate kinase